MYNDRITLTMQDILEKEFKIDARGYRPQEVDKVLDMVISDYNAYNSMIREKDRQIDALNNQILELKQKLRNAKANMDIVKNSERQVTNVDLLRRISELEKIIYGRNNDNE